MMHDVSLIPAWDHDVFEHSIDDPCPPSPFALELAVWHSLIAEPRKDACGR